MFLGLLSTTIVIDSNKLKKIAIVSNKNVICAEKLLSV